MNLKLTLTGKKLIVSNKKKELLESLCTTVQVLFAGEASEYKVGDDILIFSNSDFEKFAFDGVEGLFIRNGDLGVLAKVDKDVK